MADLRRRGYRHRQRVAIVAGHQDVADAVVTGVIESAKLPALGAPSYSRSNPAEATAKDVSSVSERPL